MEKKNNPENPENKSPEVVTLELDFGDRLPEEKSFQVGIRRASSRLVPLEGPEIQLALKNALRYIPPKFHKEIAPEFLTELLTFGRIYGYRFRPAGRIFGQPIDEYIGIHEARGLQVMIGNNLDFEVALYPYELVTYGESGQVFQNWMQYLLIIKYLQTMRNDQTLVISSGHPVGLFPSSTNAPRVIITNGLLVGEANNIKEFKRLASLGVSNYGQMTAGGWMYIGPQGIVHGTYITILNAARKYLNVSSEAKLSGVCFVSSGLGGMSCAQPKAMKIAGGIAVVAEVDENRINMRLDQGWVDCVSSDLAEVALLIAQHRQSKTPLSLAYHGNVVDLLEYLAENNITIDLLSDQTSCHDAYGGGYTPVGFNFALGRQLLQENPSEFKVTVNNSLIRHFKAIKRLVKQGAHFWDYGNNFMGSVFEAGELAIAKNGRNKDEGFIWPSYVEDIMGPMCFDRGFGPFRWVCLSGKEEDLAYTDRLALEAIDPNLSSMHRDNYNWIASAQENNLVVGTKARILYADADGRMKIALNFNQAIREGKIGPVFIGRDHHDTSGTDSPGRETSNIYDGSASTADMSTQSFAGNVARGVTVAVYSNGGGVGIGRANNGGNGIFLDGSEKVDEIIKSAILWDVMSGVARRNWARNEGAMKVAQTWNTNNKEAGHITIPYLADDEFITELVKNRLDEKKSERR